MPKKTQKNWLHTGVLRVSRVHFLYVIALAVQLVIFDIWHVTTLEATMQRWIAIAALLIVSALVWVVAKSSRITSATAYRWLIVALLATDIAVASCYVFWERGMASVYVGLYFIPIIASAVLLSRAALLATGIICSAAYFATTYSYFVIHFNEGYKSQLYGTLFFWTILFMSASLMLWSAVKTKKTL